MKREGSIELGALPISYAKYPTSGATRL